MTVKNILVVGASRGIGKELVLALAKNPAHRVIALSRNVSAMSEAFQAANIDFYELDLMSETLSVELNAILSQYDQIDYAINNAGRLVNKPFDQLSKQDILSCYQVNVMAVMETTQCLLPKMLVRGGHIVNISTIGGFQGSVKFAGLSAYSTSKAALASFTELFSEEYKESKISMNCLCLGAAQTEMLAEAFPGYEAPLSAAQMAEFIADFTLTAHKFLRGKIIPVSLSTP